jgi:hypothetical protein
MTLIWRIGGRGMVTNAIVRGKRGREGGRPGHHGCWWQDPASAISASTWGV